MSLLLATYASSHGALKAEQALKAAGLKVELIPVPRQIRSSCGFCLLCETGEATLRETGAEGLWKVQEAAGRRSYEPCP